MSKNNSIVLVTGGFDPIHSGHIKLFKNAAELGKKLIVGINSDQWLIRKKGFYFLPFKERNIIAQSLKNVDETIHWDDKDNTAIGAIKILLNNLTDGENIIFANGGDRNISNVPEIDFYRNNNKIKFEFGVGGSNKTNSSSKIINQLYKKNLIIK